MSERNERMLRRAIEQDVEFMMRPHWNDPEELLDRTVTDLGSAEVVFAMLAAEGVWTYLLVITRDRVCAFGDRGEEWGINFGAIKSVKAWGEQLIIDPQSGIGKTFWNADTSWDGKQLVEKMAERVSASIG